MKRVLIVPNDLIGSKMAAPGIRHYHIARELSSRYAVTLLLANKPDAIDLAGIEVVYLESSPYRQLRRLAPSFSVILAQGGLDVRSMVWLASATTVRTIYDLYAPFAEVWTYYGGLESSRHNRLFFRAYALRHRILLATGRAFIGANEEQRHALLGALSASGRIDLQEYRRDPALRHLVQSVGLGVSQIPPRATKADPRADLQGAQPGDRILIWPGNLWDWFDPRTLIRAMAEIRDVRDDVKLYFFGLKHPNRRAVEMDMSDQALALADELGVRDRNVFFSFGWVSYEDRQNYLVEADLGVSLHFDNMETTFAYRTRILDYLWAGLPVISTRGGALSHLIEDRHLGRTFAYEDPHGCARAILDLLDNREEYERIQGNIAGVREELTWPRVVEPLIELIDAPQARVRSDLGVRAMMLEYTRLRATLAALRASSRARQAAAGRVSGTRERSASP